MKKAVIFGAGNIGRGFIGQLFSISGYEVVFIDINTEFIDLLNENNQYPIKIVSETNPKELIIKNVRGVDARDRDGFFEEIVGADIMATAVGVNVVSIVSESIAGGLKRRWEKRNLKPLNIIICENLLNADKIMSDYIKSHLAEEEKGYFDKNIGMVEASIGRMVPVMTKDMQGDNKLRVCVEEFSILPVDKKAFKGEIPDIYNMKPFSPFEYYIQSKLFIHNMGHAAASYLGYLKGYTYIWEAIKDTDIKFVCSKAMQDSAIALSREHNIDLEEILGYADNLLFRFGNRALGDTISRVGKDTERKLSSTDRFIGSINLCEKYDIKPLYTCLGLAAGLVFKNSDDEGTDRVQEYLAGKGIDKFLTDKCKLEKNSLSYNAVLNYHEKLIEKTAINDIITKIQIDKEEAINV